MCGINSKGSSDYYLLFIFQIRNLNTEVRININPVNTLIKAIVNIISEYEVLISVGVP